MIIIGGATATGKTKIANILINELSGELLSCDASQVYKKLNIGTDKNLEIKQHLIDLVEPDEEFSVVDYKIKSNVVLDELKKSEIMPIIAGGTGYYIDTYLYDQSYGKIENSLYNENEIMVALQDDLNKFGKDYLYNQLLHYDKQAALKTHPNNTKRVLRYLTLAKTGNILSKQSKIFKPYEKYIFIILQESREFLNNKIYFRILTMIEKGLKDEVEGLLNMGYGFDLKSMQSIGYKEWKDYFYGNDSIDDVINKIYINTKRYAKRQNTWFNNQYKYIDNVLYINANEIDSSFIRNIKKGSKYE